MYDGVVLMKDDSPRWKRIMNKVFGNTSKDREREIGILAMMPNCAAELMTNRSLDEVVQWIGLVLDRQILHLSGYSGFISYFTDHNAYSQRICCTVSLICVLKIATREKIDCLIHTTCEK